MLRSVLFLLFAVLMTAVQARAEFYQWTDGDGRQFYTNEKEKIPAEYRNTAKPVEVHDERVTVEQGSSGAPVSQGKVAEHKDRYGHGEEYWRKRAENLRRQIREQQAEHDLLVKQEREEKHPVRKKTQASRDKKKAKIEKKIARLRHELDVELPEEARKADAYPGWLRE